MSTYVCSGLRERERQHKNKQAANFNQKPYDSILYLSFSYLYRRLLRVLTTTTQLVNIISFIFCERTYEVVVEDFSSSSSATASGGGNNNAAAAAAIAAQIINPRLLFSPSTDNNNSILSIPIQHIVVTITTCLFRAAVTRK